MLFPPLFPLFPPSFPPLFPSGLAIAALAAVGGNVSAAVERLLTQL